MTADDPFLAAFDALPVGAFEGDYEGVKWRAAKTAFAGGRSFRLVAEPLNGTRVVSVSLYRFADGRALLRPCDIPPETVRAVVLGLRIA